MLVATDGVGALSEVRGIFRLSVNFSTAVLRGLVRSFLLRSGAILDSGYSDKLHSRLVLIPIRVGCDE